MILVLTGTQEIPFRRLVDGIISFASESTCEQEFVIQAGSVVVKSAPNFEVFDYCAHDKLMKLVADADFIVTHAGTGSIISGLRLGKKVIVMPRMKKFFEHNDDHQTEIAKLFLSSGFVLVWEEGEEFSSVLQRLKEFSPKEYVSSFDSFGKSILSDVERFFR